MTTTDHSYPVRVLFEDWERLVGINTRNTLVREEKRFTTQLGELYLVVDPQGTAVRSLCFLRLILRDVKIVVFQPAVELIISFGHDGELHHFASTTVEPKDLPDAFRSLELPWANKLDDQFTWRCNPNGDQSALLAGALCQVP